VNCSEDDADITAVVLGLLRPEPVSAAVRRAVRDTLNLHALRARGVERARDLVRQGLKKRDQQIAKLQARVVKLENERQMRRQMLRKAASDLHTLGDEEREDVDG
jgi:septal ring factor EnvC (AmiA/AmiB activator)